MLPRAVLHKLVGTAALRAGDRVLDVGAGSGRVCVALAQAGWRVTAIDSARPMLEILRQRAVGLPLRIVAGDAVHLPFTPASFDAVVLARILHLIPDWRAVAREAISVLKPGGAMLCEWGCGSDDDAAQAHLQADAHEFVCAQGLTQSGAFQVESDRSVTLGEFLERIVDGEGSFAWDVPTELEEPCLAHLTKSTGDSFGFDRAMAPPRGTIWTAYRRD